MEGKGGERPRREPTPSQAGRPDQIQAPHQRGEGIRGVPPPHGVQAKPQQENAANNPPLGAWDILERRASLYTRSVEGRLQEQEYEHGRRELNRLEDEVEERGTPHDNLILELYSAITIEPTGTLLAPVTFRELSLEEFQQFRTQVEPLSEEQLAEEIRKAEEQFERKKKKNSSPPFPTDSTVKV